MDRSESRYMWAAACHRTLSKLSPDNSLSLSPQAAALLNDVASDIIRIIASAAEDRTDGDALVPSACEDGAHQHMVAVLIPVSSDIASVQAARLARPAPEGSPPADELYEVLTTGLVDAVLPTLLPGKLTELGRTEAWKSVDRFKMTYSFDKEPSQQRDGMSPLLMFCPERIALRLNIVFHITPTAYAAVYIAALMQYMAAELLQLGASAARESGEAVVEPRHLREALRGGPSLAASSAVALLLEETPAGGPSIPAKLLVKLQVPPQEKHEWVDDNTAEKGPNTVDFYYRRLAGFALILSLIFGILKYFNG
jgi:hypothetical protein